MSETLLRAEAVAKTFGSVTAVDGVDLTLQRGQILGVVGPNGAGKTTLLSIMSGYLLPDSGRVSLEGRDITRLTPQRRVPLGLVRTFQNIRLFGSLTVEQNVMIGQHAHAQAGFRSLVPWRTPRERRLGEGLDQAIELFELSGLRARKASELPYGIQKQVEMARALAARPRVMLLDEPAAGMTSEGRDTLCRRILQLREEGVSVVIVEHDMDIVSRVCDEITVLNFGRLLASGPTRAVLDSDEVRSAYLGT